jgi:hypothetical protein
VDQYDEYFNTGVRILGRSRIAQLHTAILAEIRQTSQDPHVLRASRLALPSEERLSSGQPRVLVLAKWYTTSAVAPGQHFRLVASTQRRGG